MTAPTAGRVVEVFLSYRRQDAAAEARLLHDRLVRRFGAEHVFLDVLNLEPGTRWLETLRSRDDAAGVVLAVIGPSWLPSLTERAAARFERPAEDIVKRELEQALARGSAVQIIPVLVRGAEMPSADALPRSLQPLSGLQAAEVAHATFDADAERLIAAIERRTTTATASPPPVTADARSRHRRPPAVAAPASARAPDDRHFDTVVRHLLDSQSLAVVLGSDVRAADLAASLARRFGMRPDGVGLAKAAQYVYVTSGRPDLHSALKRALEVQAEPGPVHRFLAGLPRRMEDAGLEPRRQLIVTTAYDAALERAFDEAEEPYDLAVYLASGPDAGRFLHVPFDGDAVAIPQPNRYGRFPIDEELELSRTVIVKVNGAVDGHAGPYRWKDNFVVTEDQYIDYLSAGPVESYVPVQILDKLTDSHCLFLGYTMEDWNLRVFLKRVWRGGPIAARSWAVERLLGEAEEELWRQCGVDLFVAPLEEYLDELGSRMTAMRTGA